MALFDFLSKRSLPRTVVVQDRNDYIAQRINTVNNLSFGRAECNSTVFTCINLLQSMVSKCDLEIYQNINGRKTKVTNHYWYDTVRFNPELKLSTKKWLGFALTSMYLEGNYFAYIDPTTKQLRTLGDIEKISPVIDGDTYYKFKGVDLWIPSAHLIHFYLLSKDGKLGMNPIDAIRAELEIHKGGEIGVTNYYKHGLNNQLYLEVDVTLGKEVGTNNLREAIEKKMELHAGMWSNHTIPQIPPLYKLKALPQPQLDFLENNKYSIAQIGALFGVPEPYLGIQGNSSTYGKASEQTAFFNSTLSNITRMIEDELTSKLLTISERKDQGLSVSFDLKNLYESDPETKISVWSKLNALGAASANEIRVAHNLPYIENEGSMNAYYRQAQYIPMSGATSTGNMNFIQATQI